MSEIFFYSAIKLMVGLLGFDINAIAIKAITLSAKPSPIMIKMLASNPEGVYFSWTLSIASIPDWYPYLKGEMYMMG